MFIPKRNRKVAAPAKSSKKYAHIVALLQEKPLRHAYFRYLAEANVWACIGLIAYFGLMKMVDFHDWGLRLTPFFFIAAAAELISVLNRSIKKAKVTGDHGDLYAAYAMHHACFAFLAVGIFSLGFPLAAYYGSDAAVPNYAIWAIAAPVALIVFGYPTLATGGWRQIIMRSGRFAKDVGVTQDDYLNNLWRNVPIFMVELFTFFLTFVVGVIVMALASK